MLKRLSIVFLAAACGPAFSGTWTVPNANADTPGNTSISPATAALRYQSIVGGGQFPGAMVITGLRFRSAGNSGPVRFAYSSFKVTISTTQAFPNTNNGHTLPSATYATNVGPDAVTVYNAALSASSPGCTGSDPCPFDMAIPFSAPFSFDPTKGRLLIDIVMSAPTGAPTGSFDAIGFPDSTSSTLANVAGDPTQPAGAMHLGGIILGLDTTTPLINAIANAAGNLTFNAPIAQGAIFIVKGVNLGPASIAIAPAAFQNTMLANTSVAVTVGSTTVSALMYYASDGQLAALLPSNTPTGAATVKITYNNQTSPAGSMTVVPSNLGIFTIDSSGSGPGIVTYADYSLVSPSKAANCGGPNTTCGAANPGDTLILWATGLGPVSGSDASGAGLGQNMANLPLTLWLGGVKAPVIYQGRSGCCIGEDQIVFTVPNNAPIGCAVPLAVQINNQVSNSTVMPIANGSRNCKPADAALASVDVQQAVNAGPVTYGSITLAHNSNGGSPAFEDDLDLQFMKITSYAPGMQPFFLSAIDAQPAGTCIVYANLNGSSNLPIGGLAALDAGSSFTVKGPNGSTSLKGAPGRSTAVISSTGSFLAPGSYSVTGAGGADVGAFSASTIFPASPNLTSPANNASVTRSNGLTVTWTGGPANGNVQIAVLSATDQSFTEGSAASCIAPASSGTFNIPPYVLLALPAGPYAGFLFGAADTKTPFTASGLGVGIVTTHIDATGFGYGAGTGGFTLK